MEVPGFWRALLYALPMTFVPLAYGAISLLFAPGRHSLCAFIFQIGPLAGIDLDLEQESVV
ncbi:hypothetical protein F2Q69_00023313 [Brassica cretica]|uniref:Uncharacterized protein n=1 Tax=Brassica cretica TaxID=69181 RepID=A0A8S9QR75_BRACR|nr:hypothetical protein F2Q69_00023313 [Brassica cretica]